MLEKAKDYRRCRWCKWYSPNERYKGTIGICRHEWRAIYGVDNAVAVDDGCDKFERGQQFWMNGEKVVE